MEIAGGAVAVVVSIVGAIVAVVTVRSQAEKEAGELYDRMVRFRVRYPEVMALSRKWERRNWGKIYGVGQPQEPQWTVYYSYVELCLSYCEMVLLAYRTHRMSRSSFQGHHKRLIRLLLTEHNPIISELVDTEGNKYISTYLVEFRRSQAKKEGWDWKTEHEALAT